MAAADMVIAIDAAILALVGKKIKSYTVEDITYTYYDIKALRDLRAYYAGLARTAGSRNRLADISGC